MERFNIHELRLKDQKKHKPLTNKALDLTAKPAKFSQSKQSL
jgi:hypothetical protein